MRVLARISYSLTCLALIAPAGAWAGMPIVGGSPWAPADQMATAKEKAKEKAKLKKASATKDGKPADPGAPERLCADCLRRKMLKEQGVNVPPAPPLPPGMLLRNNMCTVCGRPAAVHAGRQVPRSQSSQPEMMAGRSAPGRAVVGDEPGYAVMGNDPVPIGMVEPRVAAAGPTMAPAGPRDPSVMPTMASASSPSDPLMPSVESKPHVLSHLFGLSAIGRDRAIARARRDEEKHARIAYGEANTEPVQNVPASMVYGR